MRNPSKLPIEASFRIRRRHPLWNPKKIKLLEGAEKFATGIHKVIRDVISGELADRILGAFSR